jgi:hypothetical protein
MKNHYPSSFTKGVQRLEMVLNDIERQISQDVQIDLQEEIKKAKHLAELKREQELLQPQKLELATKIINWAQEFSKHAIFQKLLMYGDIDDRLFIQIGPQSHRLDPKKNQGLWAKTYIGRNGYLYYLTGYKYMQRQEGALEISSIQYLAKFFTYSSLVDLWEYIDSGDIYFFIGCQCYEDIDMAKDRVRGIQDQEVDE